MLLNWAPLPLNEPWLSKILPVTSISCVNFCFAKNVFISFKFTPLSIPSIWDCRDEVAWPKVALVGNPKFSICIDEETVPALAPAPPPPEPEFTPSVLIIDVTLPTVANLLIVPSVIASVSNPEKLAAESWTWFDDENTPIVLICSNVCADEETVPAGTLPPPPPAAN